MMMGLILWVHPLKNPRLHLIREERWVGWPFVGGWVGRGEREREFGEEWGPTFGREGKIITRHPCLKKIVVPKCIPMSKIYKKPEIVSYGKSGIILPFEAMTIENVYIKIFLKLSYLSFA